MDEYREHYAFGLPYVLMPISQGLTVASSNDATVTTLMTSSDSAFSTAAGYSLTTMKSKKAMLTIPLPQR